MKLDLKLYICTFFACPGEDTVLDTKYVTMGSYMAHRHLAISHSSSVHKLHVALFYYKLHTCKACILLPRVKSISQQASTSDYRIRS